MVILPANKTIGSNSSSLTSITPAPKIPVSFEEYWCENWDQYLEENPEEEGIEKLFQGLNANSTNHCLSLEKADYSSWAAISSHGSSAWQPVISPPCCDTYCNIQASAAQLNYWPTTSPAPNVTTLVGEGGFT